MKILTDIAPDLRTAKILDFGCGTGHLLTFLRQRLQYSGEYVGYDLSATMIAKAREKFSNVRFEQRDVLESASIEEHFDYVLSNGVFNNHVADNWGLMTAILRRLFPHARKGLAFNALSTYVDRVDPDLFYVSPERVFKFCKEELSLRVTLRHDYLVKPSTIPFEFSAYVYPDDGTAPENLQPIRSIRT